MQQQIEMNPVQTELRRDICLILTDLWQMIILGQAKTDGLDQTKIIPLAKPR